MLIKSPYKNKQVAIVGLSTEGIDSVKFFVKEGAMVTCCDRRNKEQLGETYEMLDKQKVKFSLGPNYLDNLEKYDLIVRTPGAALFLPQLEEALKRKQIITSQIKLFFEECPCPVIGVTGTKGKGTTVSLIGEILKNSGFVTHVGGNIGKPLLSSVRNIYKNHIVVLELSSFQLEDLDKSPHISVILNITQEHLNNMDPMATNYHKTRDDYVKAKENLIKHQKPADFCVINADFDTSKSFSKLTKAKTYWFSKQQQVQGVYVKSGEIILNLNHIKEKIASVDRLLLRGRHNWENISAAILAAYLAGAKIKAIKSTVVSFKGLEHRLELVGEINQVKFYNDSFSTIPETTIAAIKAFSENIILIAGGSDKGSNYTQLGQDLINSRVKTLILIGLMASKIEDAILQASRKLNQPVSFKIVRNLTNMQSIIDTAFNETKQGDIVLLSPACASFDMFKNYKDRGNQFKYYVKELAEKK